MCSHPYKHWTLLVNSEKRIVKSWRLLAISRVEMGNFALLSVVSTVLLAFRCDLMGVSKLLLVIGWVPWVVGSYLLGEGCLLLCFRRVILGFRSRLGALRYHLAASRFELLVNDEKIACIGNKHALIIVPLRTDPYNCCTFTRK